MKKIRILTITICMMLFLILALAPVFGASAITLSLDDEALASDAAPIIQDGRTLVPIRVITENLNCDVKWDKDTKTVTITEENGNVLKLIIGSKEGIKIKVDGTERTFQMDVPALIISGRTMVPIRAITENLSSAPQIGWSNTLRKVCIYTPDYLTEKGISDVNSYVATFKAPPAEATGVTDLGTCQVDIWNPMRQCHIVKVGKIHYINAYDFLSQYLVMPSNSTSVKYNKGTDYIERIVSSPFTEEIPVSVFGHPLSNYLYEDKDVLETVRYTVGDYNIRGADMFTTKIRCTIGPNETIEAEDIKDYDFFGLEGKYTQEDIFDEFFDYRTDLNRNQWTKTGEYTIESKEVQDFKHTQFLHPVIMYQNELYLPMEEGEFAGFEFSLTGNTLSGTVIPDKPATTPSANTQPAPAPVEKIAVGDTVYATAVFCKCWGIVDEIKGTKSRVSWVQVTGLYDLLVTDYSEIDIMSQASMSTKGIMIGASTWVDLSELHKK